MINAFITHQLAYSKLLRCIGTTSTSLKVVHINVFLTLIQQFCHRSLELKKRRRRREKPWPSQISDHMQLHYWGYLTMTGWSMQSFRSSCIPGTSRPGVCCCYCCCFPLSLARFKTVYVVYVCVVGNFLSCDFSIKGQCNGHGTTDRYQLKDEFETDASFCIVRLTC